MRRSNRNDTRSSTPRDLSSIARSISTSNLFSPLRMLTGASSGARTRTAPGCAGSGCVVNWMASTSSGRGVQMPVSMSHTSTISPSASGKRMAAGTMPVSVMMWTVPSASTSNASSGPDIMPCDMPVSVRHTSNPRGDTAALIPRSWGVCPTTMRLAPSASHTASSSSCARGFGCGTEYKRAQIGESPSSRMEGFSTFLNLDPPVSQAEVSLLRRSSP
mmetsp:Transcript_10009/g.23258  ORF Transcript_10009/g.23258 Transcript_10009/m.23258 type:complete len:218 (+) Transcript_10009:555-1208(+)